MEDSMSHPGLYQQQLKTIRHYNSTLFDEEVKEHFENGWEIHSLHTVASLNGIEYVAFMMHHGAS
jgi:hypothetical protein